MVSADPVADVFLLCFLVGLIFSVVSFLLGSLNLAGHAVHGHGHFDGHAGHGHGGQLGNGHGHGGTHAHGVHLEHGCHAEPGATPDQAELPNAARSAGPSPINLSTLIAFLVGFGGVGYIARVGWGVGLAVAGLLGALVGLAGAAAIFLFLTRVLLRYEAYMDPSEYRMVGTIATVTVPIRDGRVGEIVYVKGGTRRSDGARGVGGQPIERGTEVVIERYENGIAYVEPFDQFIQRSPAPGAAAPAAGRDRA